MASGSSLKSAALRARAILLPESEVPPWLQAFERFGVQELNKGKAPKDLKFPNDRLYQAYLSKNPEFRQHPLDLNSDNPSPMKLFVLAQAALMEKGHSRRTAYNIVEAEFNKALAGSSLSAGQTALTAAQKEEEDVLQKAVQERREQFGPPANLYSEPVTPAFNFRPRQSQQSSSQQQSQPNPLSFQPRTNIPAPQADPGMHPAMYRQEGSQKRGQAEEQGASNSNQFLQQGQVSHQTQNTAPAGFIHFGVEPKGPAE
ncbi:hypothetical protein ABBQ38_011667 [Trebouxia sp. C0009 RCD-2024]